MPRSCHPTCDDPQVTGLRGLLWRLFAVLTWLLLPVALTSGWLAAVVTDTDSYVDTVGPLASDATVQRAVADRLEGLAIGTVENATGARVNDQNRELVSSTVTGVVESEEFESAWRSANRVTHRQAIRLIESDDRTVTDDGRVAVELGPVYDAVVRSLDQRGLVNAGAVPKVNATFPLVRASDLDRVQAVYELLDAAGFWLPVAWLVLVAATLLVAPERRRAVGWLAWGSIAGLVLLTVGLLLAREAVVSEVGSYGDAELVRAIWDVLVSRLYYAIGVAFLIAVVVLVVRAVLGRRRSRRYVAETHPA
jgi:hypothetical protein